MSVIVDPALLDGYAGQLERNSELLAGPLRSFALAQCGQTGGMTGLLATAKPTVDVALDVTERMFSSGARHLFQVATNLRAAATAYRAGDEDAAERVWLALPRRKAPGGYAEHNDDRHRGDFRDPFVPRPVPPAPRQEFERYVEEVRHHTGIIDGFLERYLHLSLGEKVLPWISGDWDTLRRDADGYAALAGVDGIGAVRVNLAYGMDSLSAGWDSPAATQFEFTIRERWLPSLETLGNLLLMHKEACENMAQQAETMLHALVIAVEVVKFWVIEKVLRIVKLAGALVGAGRVADELMELLIGVLRAWHQIKILFEVLESGFANLRESVQLAGAQATLIEQTWLASGENRLDPLRAG